MGTSDRSPSASDTSRTAATKPGAATSILWAPERRRPSQVPCPTVTASIATLALTGCGSTRTRAVRRSARSVRRAVSLRFTVTVTGGVPSSPSPRRKSTWSPGDRAPSHGVVPARTPSTITSSVAPSCSAIRRRPAATSGRIFATTCTVRLPATSTRPSKVSKPSFETRTTCVPAPTRSGLGDGCSPRPRPSIVMAAPSSAPSTSMVPTRPRSSITSRCAAVRTSLERAAGKSRRRISNVSRASSKRASLRKLDAAPSVLPHVG